jgi:hypothetical protein
MAKPSVTSLVSAGKAQRVVTVGTPVITTVEMPFASTEYSTSLPAGAFNYMLKLREGIDGTSPSFLVSFVDTTDLAQTMNVPASTPFVDDQTLLSLETDFYFQCDTAGQTMEITYNLIAE